MKRALEIGASISTAGLTRTVVAISSAGGMPATVAGDPTDREGGGADRQRNSIQRAADRRGRAHELKGNRDAAIADYRKAESLDAQNDDRAMHAQVQARARCKHLEREWMPTDQPAIRRSIVAHWRVPIGLDTAKNEFVSADRLTSHWHRPEIRAAG